MDYLSVKLIHQLAVASSVTVFSARGLGALRGASWPKQPAARMLQHGNDTVLLLTALFLAITAHINPLTVPWLMVKIIGLLVYIGLGTLVMRKQVCLSRRVTALVGALALFGFLVTVALSKSPVGFLAWVGQ
jgi:uncharacterized membrane protein SirB2